MKSNMSGIYYDYREMFKKIMNWDTGDSDPRFYGHGTHPVLGNQEGHYLYNIGWSLSDAPFHGWEGEALRNELTIYHKVQESYQYFLKSLAEAIGYEFPEDQDVWKYYLKDIDTNDILVLMGKREKKNKEVQS